MPPLRQALLWMLGRRQRVRVNGTSMEPAIKHGSLVYVDPNPLRTRPLAVGDVVHCRHPFKKSVTLIKRVRRLADGGIFVVGDNPSASTDSRTLGNLSEDDLLGRVDMI